MSLLIIHLTDLHIDADSEGLDEQAIAIATSATSTIAALDAVHIVVSGDIANRGQRQDFEAASKFLKALASALLTRTGLTPSTIISAGNHDCDFTGEQSIRDLLLMGVKTTPDILTPAIVNQLAQPLSNFSALQIELCPEINQLNPWVAEIRLEAPMPVRYVLLNSAVMSRISEAVGSLYVPIPQLDPPRQNERTIFVMHHPYNWLLPNNARELAQFAAQTADIFLMGHEHVLWAQQVADLYDESVITYFKGHVLRDKDNPSESAFQTITIDAAFGFLSQTFRLSGKTYHRNNLASLDNFLPWPEGGTKSLKITAEGYRKLASSGANFSHRRKEIVTLQDIYVWPNLKRISPERDTGNAFADSLQMDAEELVINHQSLAQVIVIKAGEQFGKTALAKMLCLNFCKKGAHPLLMSATNVSSWRERSLNERIDDAIDSLYSKRSRDEFRQLQASQKVLIIDDFDLAHLEKGYTEALRALRSHFSRIILMVDSHPGMEIALAEFLNEDPLHASDIFEILPSNYHHRLQIIERWLHLGAENENSEEIKATAAKLAKIVDETLGRNLIPSLPIFVLIVLQQAEASHDLTTVVKSGSHGFLYESMILQALSSKVSICNLVTALSYLTEFALTMASRNAEHLSQNAYEAFSAMHCSRFKLTIPVATIQSQLTAAEIIDCSDNTVRFKFPFHQYYFFARSLAQLRSWEKLQPEVETLVQSLHTERSANVLLFLAHLVRDSRIAERIVAHSRAMFSRSKEFDLFERQTLFVKYGLPAIRQILIEGSRAAQVENHQTDESESEKGVNDLAQAAERRLEARLQDALSMNEAFKTIQVLGQVLRNHAGEIEGEEKDSIAEACVSLGLRLLTFMVELTADYGDEMISFRASQIRAEDGSLGDNEIADELERYLPGLVSSIVMGTSIKIANAIGAEDLAETINSVLGSCKTREMLKLVTQLEHFSRFPQDEIIAYEKKSMTKSDFLPYSVLRRFIIRRFYLFPVREELKRSICDRFTIRALPFSVLEQKALRKPSTFAITHEKKA